MKGALLRLPAILSPSTAGALPGAMATIAVLALYAACHWLFLRLDQVEPYGNVAEHLYYCLKLYHAHGDAGLEGIASSLSSVEMSYYPPLLYLASLPCQWVTGPGRDGSIWAVFFFGTLLAVLTYLYVVRLHGAFPAWVAALVVSCAPGIVWYERTFYPAVPLAALTMLTLYALLQCRRFSSLAWSLAVAVSVALGLLLKWSFIVYACLPLSYTILQALFTRPEVPASGEVWKGRARQVRIRNLLLSALVSLNLCAWWYAPRVRWLLQAAVDIHHEHVRHPWPWVGPHSYWNSVLHYGGYLEKGLLAPPVFWCALASLLTCVLVRKWRTDDLVLPLLTCLSTPLLLAVHSVVFDRYVLPVAGPATVLACALLARVPRGGTLLLGLLAALYAPIPLLWMEYPHFDRWNRNVGRRLVRGMHGNYMDPTLHQARRCLWIRLPGLRASQTWQALADLEARGPEEKIVLLISQQTDRFRFAAAMCTTSVHMAHLDPGYRPTPIFRPFQEAPTSPASASRLRGDTRRLFAIVDVVEERRMREARSSSDPEVRKAVDRWQTWLTTGRVLQRYVLSPRPDLWFTVYELPWRPPQAPPTR